MAVYFLFLVCAPSVICLQMREIEHARSQSTVLSLKEHVRDNAIARQRLSAIKSTPPLGFRNLLADSVFLNFLQYFSDVSNKKSVDKTLSPAFFESIISLDPFYRNYYLFLSSSTTLYAAQPQKAVDLMDKGLKEIDPEVVSDSFYIWRYKGVDELLFIGDSQAAKESFERAADWASRSDDPSSELMRMVSQQTADFLETDPDSSHAQIAAWSSVLFNALDDATREKAAERIESFGGSVDFLEDGNVHIESNTSDSSDESEVSS